MRRAADWRELGHEISFGGVNAASRYLGVSKTRAERDLQELPLYQKYKVPKRSRVPNPYRVYRVGELVQLDLLDVSNLQHRNGRIRFWLVLLDTFSRYVVSEMLPNKRASTVTAATRRLIEKFETTSRMKVERALMDRGKEFVNREFMGMLREADVDVAHAVRHAHGVERVQLTLQRILYRYLAQPGKGGRYRDVFDDIIDTYNNKFHRIIGCTPAQGIKPQFRTEVLNAVLYDHYKRSDSKRRKRKNIKLWPGDLVRVLKYRDNFERGYGQKFSDAVYKIKHMDSVHSDPTYMLVTHPGQEPVLRSFVSSELSKIRG